MRHTSAQYPGSHFRQTTCKVIVRMPECFVQKGCMTWTSVLSHLELYCQLYWHGLYGDDFCGQKTFNSNDPALMSIPTNAERTLAYIYVAEFYNVPTCKAYKANKPAPARKEAERAEGTSSEPMPAQDGVGGKRSSNPPSPESKGVSAASKSGGSKAPTSPKVSTKEQAQQACVSVYKSMLTANPAGVKEALDAAHVELHEHNGVDGLHAATKGPHVKVLVDAELGTAHTTSVPGSVKTGAGTARAYFVPTWAPSKKRRKRVVADSDSD